MKAKSNKGKMPAGAPKGMNPFEFFRKGGEQRKAMFKKGGYNTPTQNPLPKRNMGGDDPLASPSMQRRMASGPNVPSASSLMTNPFVKPNPIMTSMSKGVTPMSTGSIKPPISTVTPSSTVAPVSTVSSTPAAPVLSAKEKIAQAKADAKIAKIKSRSDKKVAKDAALAKEYESGTRKVKTASDWVDTGINAAGVVLEGMNAVKDLRNREQKGGSIKPKASKGMIVKSKRK